MQRLARIVSGSRTKWLWVITGIGIMVAVTPYANKNVTTADQTAFLPKSAQSTQVDLLEKQLPGSTNTPAVVVYSASQGTLNQADFQKITRDTSQLRSQVERHEIIGPMVSSDKKAAILTFAFVGSDQNGSRATAARAILEKNNPAGLAVQLTGAAGFSADLVNAFSGINGKLLGASIAVVALLLLITYRSPWLWLVPLFVVGIADQSASAIVNELSIHTGLVLNGENTGILRVLVFGAGTDYALLLISRYREELHRVSDRHEAMRKAILEAAPAIIASASTVILALLSLTFASLNNDRSLGPVGAIGIASALIAMLFILPPLLLLFGRGLFWPRAPKLDDNNPTEQGVFARIGRVIERHPRLVAASITMVLLAGTVGLSGLNLGLKQTEQFRGTPQSVLGQNIISEHYSAGASAPLTVIVDTQKVATAERLLKADSHVTQVLPGPSTTSITELDVTLRDAPDSQASYQTIKRLRNTLNTLGARYALVGGLTATNLDTDQAASRDRMLVIPIILAIVLVILIILLRSLIAPLILIATVVLSYGAALGITNYVSIHLLHFAAIDASTPLLGFVFLVALGVDYNIFLVTRTSEEVPARGSRAAMSHALAVTGGVITSAGAVLAATFAVLGVLPLAILTQLGVLVGIGVLVDTLLVRTLLVPSVAIALGDNFWWPRHFKHVKPKKPVPSARPRRHRI